MAKGQMRSNKEKKKPKQDKNKQKGGAAPSPFAGMQSQSNPVRTRTARNTGAADNTLACTAAGEPSKA